MNKAEAKLKYLSRYYSKGGVRFSVKGRQWVYDELFLPLESWKLWPRNLGRTSNELRPRIGELVTWSPELVTELSTFEAKHPGEGLQLIPIMVVFLCLQRGAGKTMNAMGWSLATMADEENFSISFAARSSEQTRSIIRENVVEPIANEQKLRETFEVAGNRVIYPRKNRKQSFLEFTTTAYGSITSRRRDVVFIDEARDIDARTFAALLLSIRSKTSLRCPNGHRTLPYVADTILPCPACATTMVPRIPKVVITTAAGLLEGKEKDWSMELLAAQEDSPKPYMHLYNDNEAANPNAAQLESDMITEVFAGVKSLTTHIDVELHNATRRAGEDFVSSAQVKAIVDRSLVNEHGSQAKCFAFLDTSRVVDLTSILAIGNDDARDVTGQFRFIRNLHISAWKPSDFPTGVIDAKVIEEAVCDFLWKFPGCIEFLVDTRSGMGWAVDLVTNIRAGRVQRAFPFRNKVRSLDNAQGERRDNAWQQFEVRITSGTYRIFPDKRFEEELEMVRRVVRPDGTVEFRDRNRRVRHVEVVESAALLCGRIHNEMTRPRDLTAEKMKSPVIQRALKDLFGGDHETKYKKDLY